MHGQCRQVTKRKSLPWECPGKRGIPSLDHVDPFAQKTRTYDEARPGNIVQECMRGLLGFM